MTAELPRKVVVGSDHAGFALKEQLKAWLLDRDVAVDDVGTHSLESTDYPQYAHEVALRVSASESQVLGLLICGTGLGVSYAANRHPGIRAACCSHVFTARMARQHNDANVLCLGARVVGPGLAEELLAAFLGTDFEGGRHQRRVDLIERPSTDS